jgi:uncharacterized membrane protein
MIKLPIVIAAVAALGLVAPPILSALPVGPEQIQELGSEMSNWPVTTIMGMIILACLGVIAFIVRKMFTVLEANGQAIGSNTHSIDELSARLNVRPCLEKKDG